MKAKSYEPHDNVVIELSYLFEAIVAIVGKEKLDKILRESERLKEEVEELE